MKKIQALISNIGDLLFPSFCMVCSRPCKSGICPHCFEDIVFIRSPRCPACGRELRNSASGDHLCGPCLCKHPLFSTALAVAHYQKPITSLLHKLKYQGDMAVLPVLHSIVQQAHIPALTGDEVVVPVPLHRKRLRKRGFNQAVLLAGILYPDNKSLFQLDSLQRCRQTVPQTGLDGKARRRNLSKAFIVRDRDVFFGKKVILVDDVYTTGSTVSECSRTLLAAGASAVHVVTLARVRE